jgi:hypothetical protein
VVVVVVVCGASLACAYFFQPSVRHNSSTMRRRGSRGSVPWSRVLCAVHPLSNLCPVYSCVLLLSLDTIRALCTPSSMCPHLWTLCSERSAVCTICAIWLCVLFALYSVLCVLSERWAPEKGANLFFSEQARLRLEADGVIVFKVRELSAGTLRTRHTFDTLHAVRTRRTVHTVHAVAHTGREGRLGEQGRCDVLVTRGEFLLTA